MLNEANLSSEERIRRAVQAAKLETSPAYLKVLRNLSPAVKLANANGLFVMACDAFYYLELRRGHTATFVMQIATWRMLNRPIN